MAERKFELGQPVMTFGVADKIEAEPDFGQFVIGSINRFMVADWGDTCEEDAAMNDEALKSGEDRIFAKYTWADKNVTIWIITEWDRSITTVLFPEEY